MEHQILTSRSKGKHNATSINDTANIVSFHLTGHFLIRHLQKPPRRHIPPPTPLLAHFPQCLGLLSVDATWFENFDKCSTKFCCVNGWSNELVGIDSYAEVFDARCIVIKVIPLGEDDLWDTRAGRTDEG